MKFALNVIKENKMTKSSFRKATLLLVIMAIIFLGGNLSWAKEKSVSEEILIF